MDAQVADKPWFHEGLKFKCTGCGKCCTGSSGYVYLSPNDLKNLVNHFKMTQDQFTRKFTRLVDGNLALLDRPNSDECIFLKDKKCTVYEARPVQCRTFPWWVGNLRNNADWEEASLDCEGINHPDAPLISTDHIEQELHSYIDNLINQNFN